MELPPVEVIPLEDQTDTVICLGSPESDVGVRGLAVRGILGGVFWRLIILNFRQKLLEDVDGF